MNEKINGFIEKIKSAAKHHSLPDKLKHQRFALVYLVIASKFKAKPSSVLVPTRVVEEFGGKIEKRSFMELIALMQTMGYIKKLPNTGTSWKRPLEIRMINNEFIHDDYLNMAMETLEGSGLWM